MKVGLFFGSFNPIHHGHLIIANIMVETTDLDEVWFIVSPRNPFKSSQTLLHEFDRYDLVQAAVEGNDRFKVSDIEFHLSKPSYTIDTLTYLQEKAPQNEYGLILGGDNLLTFTNWKNYQTILENYFLYVYPRPGFSGDKLIDHPNVKLVEAPLMEISATFIRKLIKEGKSIKYLVPNAVAEIIKDKKFFL